MVIIPAIDLKNGQCVRLRQGLMEDTTVFSDNPAEMAAQWVGQGAKRLQRSTQTDPQTSVFPSDNDVVSNIIELLFV